MKSLSFSVQNQTQQPAFFRGLSQMQLVNRLTAVKKDPEELLAVLFDFFTTNTLRLQDFELSKGRYSRTILYREQSGFEIMIARWDKRTQSPIHGHPAFSLFYVVKGKLKETLYTRNQDRIDEKLTTVHSQGDYTYHQGVPDRFDNSIHRLSALEESLSLHIYSDDALKGEVF